MRRALSAWLPATTRARLRRLQWKLTFSYMAVTVGATLVVELLLLLSLVLFINSGFFVRIVLQGMEGDVVPNLRPLLLETPPDADGIQAYLASLASGVGGNGVVIDLGEDGDEAGRLLVIDEGGVLLGTLGTEEANFARGARVPWEEVPGAGALWEQALAAPTPESAYRILPGDRFVALVPVPANEGALAGVVLLSGSLPGLDLATLGPVAQLLLLSLLPLTLITGLIGTLFGAVTARGLSRRLQAVSDAAGAWSEGDFRTSIQDRSGDELGELTRRLNVMAEQLENLLQTRQELATLEERNRLARDLHDSVKQQVFATAMQVAAARSLMDSNPEAAKENLAQAEQLIAQSQQELAGLIQELRPAALEGRGLAEAVREYVPDWAQRTGIEAGVRVQGERPLPLPMEQALFRVLQEALANVARHSGATAVDGSLVWRDGVVSLTVRDNGRGFDQGTGSGTVGIGLQSMAERMALLDGTLQVDSERGKGTRVVAWLRFDAG